jgi:hypothetical protein
MRRERKVHVRQADLSRGDELVPESLVCLIVPFLAVWALEVAYFDYPERRVGISLDSGEVGFGDIGIGWSSWRGNLRRIIASYNATFGSLLATIRGSARDEKSKTYEHGSAIDVGWNHLLNRPPIEP